MIETWAVGDDVNRTVLEASAVALEELADDLEQQPWMFDIARRRGPVHVRAEWEQPPPGMNIPISHSYYANLAFDSPLYRPDPLLLRQRAARLRATPMPAKPITGGGGIFAGTGTPRPPPRIVPSSTSTHGGTTARTHTGTAAIPPVPRPKRPSVPAARPP